MTIPIKDRIVGTWKLVSWTFKDAQGNDVHYFGEHAAGILMYDSHGYMNAQLTKEDRPAFSSAALDGATRQRRMRPSAATLHIMPGIMKKVRVLSLTG